MIRRGVVVAILLVVVATAPVAAVNPGPENADPGYAGDNCTIETTELQAAIEDWATGTIDTSRLQTVIQYWATSGPVPNCQSQGLVVTVTDVVDGDTLDVRYENGSTDTVRLIGVDTPEVHVETDPAEFEGIPDSPAGHAWLRGWGENASAYATRIVSDRTVRLTFDEQTDRRGAYGRLLAYVHVNSSFVLNAALVEKGYARVYSESDFQQESEYAAAEAGAQLQEIGVWAYDDSGGTDPTNDTGALAVARIHADADGNDHETLNDEYIVFENTGNSSLEMGGWTVADSVGHTYTFPSGFTLAPGEQVTLYTGSGTDSDSDLYWGSGSAIWNNGGDTIIVTTDNGEEVLRTEYS